jgi:peptidoglycan-associated lipoprotein
MKIKALRLPLFLAFILLGTTLLAQKNPTAEADKAFEARSYYSAVDLYKKAYNKVRSSEDKKEVLYKIGFCYYKIEDYKNSQAWLGKAIKAGYSKPDAQLMYAKTMQNQGLYDKAVVEFSKYKELNPSDPNVDQYIKNCEMAQDWVDNPTRYLVERDPVLNSKQRDFSPTWTDKRHTSIAFTSTREGSIGDNLDPNSGDYFSSIWQSEQDKKSKKWMVPNIVDENQNIINTGKANEGSACMDSRFKTLYITRCSSEKKATLGCGIYVTKQTGNMWSEPELIPLSKDPAAAVGHPSIGLKDEYLFFASDMKGGHGGKDIWFAKWDKKAKEWTNVTNLGPKINTAGDEMFPYIHEDGRLFFASDGHPGMGALDIFVAQRKGTEDAWEDVQNMKYPINSSYNDFGIIFEGTANMGYLTSDRPGTRGLDDIWGFRVPPLKFIIAGTITDVDNGAALPGVLVKLIGTDGSTVELKTDELGYYEFDQVTGSTERYIKPETSYTLQVSKEDYLSGKGQETTVGLIESTKLVHDFKLQSIKKQEIRFPQVLYDLGKWDLQVNDSVNSKDSLDYLYQTLIDNPTLVIELMSHTDTRDTDQRNQVLSQKRAQSCVDYLVSKGIPSDRMEPKGYGESQPLISDEEIAKLPTTAEKEAAHQVNRRTTFRVLRTDYVPAAPPAPEGTGTEN